MSNFRIYNDALCPDLWDSAMHLSPKIRTNLLQMAYDFYSKTQLSSPIVDVYLMGSGANYNWTPESDVDVHIIIDYSKLQMPADTAIKTVKTAGASWNSNHNVFIKGHKVEMNLQNSTASRFYSNGIYSLVTDQWIHKPSKISLQIDKSTIKLQYEVAKRYIQTCIGSGDRGQMKAAKNYLDAYRQYGLDTGGELSYENIIYKMLRARGYIKQLKDSITQAYDRQMTIREKNTPITESPMMAKHGNDVLSGDKPLKGSTVSDVIGNIIVIRQPTDGAVIQKGWTLVYFMDSDESAREMAHNKIPYLMIPRGTFMGGGSPITDVWKKKFQKPGHEHILGLIEGHSDEDNIFIDMISVRPGWRRNHIAKLMIDRLKKSFEKAKVSTSTQTTDGKKLFGKLGLAKPSSLTFEGVGAGIPDDDRLKIKNTDGSTRRWQVRSKNAPKTPQMTDEIIVAIPKFDAPDKCNEDITHIPTHSTPSSSANRVNLFPITPSDEMPPELLKVIKMIERVLDRRSINQKFFDMKYVAELVDDSFAAELPEKSISDGLKMAVIKYLSNDYDIRQNGQMIKEVGTPKLSLQEADLRGEWWFQGGQAMFADGDTGDINHEAMAADALRREILDDLGVDASDNEYVGENFDELADEIFDSIGDELTPSEKEGWSAGNYISVILSYFKQKGNKEALEKMAYAFSSDRDPREYALIHWGWQRVKGNVIQTQTLTEQDLSNIVSGLDDAYADEMDDSTVFDIEVMSSHTFYSDVPLSVLESRNLIALNPYRSKY